MTSMPKLWDDATVREFLTPEAHQKSKEQFLKTHIDIDKIRADYLFPHEGSDEFVTQDEFRDAILKSKIRDDNRIFILRGETGSGKSQLCQWLEYQIGMDPNEGDEEHVALHVSRSKTGIGDILEIISGPVDTDITVSNVSDLDPKKVADAIITTLEAFGTGMEQFSQDEIDVLTEDRPNATDLRSILKENIVEYQESAASDSEKRKTDLITENDYRDLALAAFGSTKGADTLFPSLQSEIHKILSRNLGVEDFQGKLEELSEEYVERGLRPVLICEDLTTFTVLKEQLLDHIFQLDSGHYDVVLGWTSGWEKDDLSRALGTSKGVSTYMEDRAEGYLSTTDEQGRAYFLDDDITTELAQTYLSAIIKESNSSESLPEDVLDAFGGLYPFNESFIQQAYNHLIQDGNKRRTPRLLLMRVIRECLNATVAPFEAIEQNPYVERFPSPVDLGYSEEIQRLGKWYGSPTTDRRLVVRREIPETFDVSIEDVESDKSSVYFHGDIPAPSLRLDINDGDLRPGEYVTLRATLDGRGEEGAEILRDEDLIETTGSDGRVDIKLPSKPGKVTYDANKDDATDSITLTIVEDDDPETTVSLTAFPKNPEVGDEVTVTARVNGESKSGVTILRDGTELGTTHEAGRIHFNAPDSDSTTIEAVFDDAKDEIELDIQNLDVHIPVNTGLDGSTVKKYQLQYRDWIKVGGEYDSSTVLREGAAGVLEEWHDPTLLGNLNARNDGINGIYYTKGSDIPVSIVGADERQGLSFDLDFGVEYDDIYEPLFWHGISDSGEFPQEDKYALNYDLLRNWADEQVAEFRMQMRKNLEQCINPMTLEEFVVLSQFLVLNATTGQNTIDEDMMFNEPPAQTDEHYVPGADPEQPDYLGKATNKLLRSRSAAYNLAEGLFLLKSNVVDHERLSTAVESVKKNLDWYLKEAMAIDTSDLDSSYRISSTRSGGPKVGKFFEHVKDYATALEDVDASSNAEHVTESIDRIDMYYEKDHTIDELQSTFDRLTEVLNRMGISKETPWINARDSIKGDADLDLGQFQLQMESFNNISEKRSHELIATLHEYHESREEEKAWDIYDSIAEIIEEVEGVSLPDDTGFRERINELSEFETYEKYRYAVETNLRGE